MGNFGNSIVDAYLSGQRTKLAREQNQAQIESQRAQQELREKLAKQEQQQFEQELRRKTDEFNTNMNFQRAKFDVEKQDVKSRIAERFAGVVRQGGGGLSRDDEGNYSVSLFETPTAVGQAQAEIAQPVLDQKTAAESKLIKEKTNEEIRKETVVEPLRQKGREALETLRNANAKDRMRLQQTFSKELEGLKNSYRIGQIQTAAELKDAVENGDLIEDLDDVFTGDFTFDTMKQIGLSPAKRQAMLQASKKEGITMLSDKQVQTIQKLKRLNDIVIRAQELEKRIEKAGLIGRSLATLPLVPADIKSEYNQLQTNIGVLVKQIGTDTGTISNEDAERFSKAIPTYVVYEAAGNKVRLAGLLKDYQSVQDSVLSVVKTEEQRIALREKYNLMQPKAPKNPNAPKFIQE